MGRMSRDKGARGELECAAKLTELGVPAVRSQQRLGTPDSPDLILDDHRWIYAEVKRRERFHLYKAMEQAEKDCGLGTVPVVFHRSNGKEWVAILSLEDFAILIRKPKQPEEL